MIQYIKLLSIENNSEKVEIVKRARYARHEFPEIFSP